MCVLHCFTTFAEVVVPPVAPTVPPPPPITPDLAALQMVGMAGPITRTLDEGSEAQDGDEKEEPDMNEEELKQILKELPPLTVVTITKVLRTLFLWTSWIHEDVGHAWASFIYNPIHTPGFVPADGRGIPMPALIYRVAMFRNFVALERPAMGLVFFHEDGIWMEFYVTSFLSQRNFLKFLVAVVVVVIVGRGGKKHRVMYGFARNPRSYAIMRIRS